MRFLFRRRQYRELAPDEIFLDSSNLPQFDTARLEGRLERPIPGSTFMGLSLMGLLMFFVLAAQAAELTVGKGATYAAQSERNRIRPEVIFAERGAITDRTGDVLVQNKEGEKGFPERSYETPGFAHLLGYVSYPQQDTKGNFYETEMNGLAGVERAFNERLKGKNGTHLIEENALGEIESEGTVEPVRTGETLVLSVDARVQRAFYAALQELADRIPYKGGAGVMMDVETGEIIALASYPEYNPNILSSGTPYETIEAYAADTREPYLDRPVSGLYTPGSVVKPLIAAGALNDGIISPEKTIVSTGSISLPNPYNPEHPSVFKDWKAHGATDMRRAIAVSSDVYFYSIGGGFADQKGLGIERLDYWYRAFGFDTKTGIELANENQGFLPTPTWKEETYGEPWRIGDTYNTAIGQYAVQVTPLEIVRAVAAIANGGRLIRPTLLSGGTSEGVSIAVNQDALKVAREGMRQSVTEGTATGLNPYTEVRAAGKTGTAQLGAHNEWYNSWIVGFFPYEKPKYAFAVVMERGPAGTSVGGVYVMSQVFAAMRETAPEYFAP